MGPFVVGSCFGLKSDGFAWESPQKVKKTSSDILVDFILIVNLQYLVNMAPNRGLLRFQLSSLCWFCGQKRDVKTYILRTRCAQGQFKVSLCDTDCLYLSYCEVSCTEDAGPGDVSWSQDSVSFMSRFRVGVSSRSQKNVKRYFDFEFTVLGEHGAQQGIFEISIFRDLKKMDWKSDGISS